MKRVGARWSPDGADRTARLLAAKANNELNDYASQSVKKVNKRLTVLIDRTRQHISEDLVKHAESPTGPDEVLCPKCFGRLWM